MIAASVRDSTFDTSSLAEGLLQQYGFPGSVGARFWTRGVNDTYEVVADSRYMLRIYRHGWRTREQVEWELSLLHDLSDRGVDVSTPVAATDGSTVQTIDAPEGPRFAVLFTDAPGSLPASTEEGAADYGAACARLHIALDASTDISGNRFDIGLAHLIDEPLAVLDTCIDDHSLLDEVHRTADLARAGIQARAPALTWAICHGDLHGGNAHRTDDGRTTFFDFDCGGPGWRSYDIAVYRWSSNAVRASSGDDERWDDFIRAYTKVRPVADADLEVVPYFVAARQLWLMGLHAALLPAIGAQYLTGPVLDRHRDILRHWRKHHLESASEHAP